MGSARLEYCIPGGLGIFGRKVNLETILTSVTRPSDVHVRHAKLKRGDLIFLQLGRMAHHRAAQRGPRKTRTNELAGARSLQSHGAKLAMLPEAPTLARLRNAQIYFIVSPDIPKWNPNPNYVQPKDANQVAEWVKQGGVLVLMENDPSNADLDHFNLIAGKFGLHFDNVLKHHVIEPHHGPGYIPVTGSGPIFHHPHTLYMKDTCGISVKAPATAVFSDKEGIVIASANYGKGMAVAVIDPWLYNEYTDHRKVNPAQQNFAAGQEFALWLIQHAQHNPHPQQESR